jgi:transposase
MPRHMTQDQRLEAIRLYLAGSTRDALAERYGRHRRTIDNLIRRRGALRGEHWTATRRRFIEAAQQIVLTINNDAVS